MEIFNDLPAVWTYSWQQLEEASQENNHPWRLPVIANLTGSQVSQRTVVLRKVSQKERHLRFYTDLRSAKISQKDERLRFSWLFYNTVSQIQLRIQSEGVVVSVEEADRIWRGLPVYARSTYASIKPPGTIITRPKDALPAGFFTMSSIQTDAARANFMAIDNQVKELEFLQLHREGHRRARFVWTDGQWESNWLVP
ncbi:hypothetical protein [Lewinella cohaerens]|uniref:hypothetical protein n=1 Tax=Lewinella cohaerens TaxID=70995 RepID=UPI00037CBD49|nr:hypothetical protein [Lewinella cohaerens]